MAGNGKCKTSPAQLETEQRQIQALNLRLAGVSFERIAEELGYGNRSSAYSAVRAALEKARSEPAEELRELELARLDEMQAGLWEAAIAGVTDSVTTILRLMGHRARLLGLERKDSPIKVKLPKLETPDDAMTVVSALLEKVTEGEVTPDDAAKLTALVQGFMKIAETAELAARLARLEEQQAHGTDEHDRYGAAVESA